MAAHLEDSANESVLPVVRQPNGTDYYLKTWSGRVQLINTLVFVWMLAQAPSSFLMPDPDLIRFFGAKSLADLALGEYWRFFTPMFVHIGVIHFAFNSLGLRYVGYQLEYMLGGRWFLFVYLLAGVVGNVASCVFNVRMSAGASGALFGLLGAGFVLEQSVSHRLEAQFGPRPRRRIYSGMILLNIMLGIFIPVIDNAAHIGGLVAGIAAVRSLLWLRPNRLERQRPIIGRAVLAAVVMVTGAGIFYSAQPEITIDRLNRAAQKTDSTAESWLFTQDALRIDEKNPSALLWAGRILVISGHHLDGTQTISQAIIRGAKDQDVRRVAEELSLLGFTDVSEHVLNELSRRPVI